MAALETRRLGTSDLHITRVGIGTAPIGSSPQWKVYWGQQDERSAVRAIQTAIDLGVNWIDTAPFYGWGRAERIVGQAIKGRRDRVYVFTKCGTLNDGQGGWYESLKPASIRREVESSLSNLQTDYIDLYQFHDPDPATPVEESWATMQGLIQEGKVRYGGLSNHPVAYIERARAIAPVASLQHQYSLLARVIEEDILPYAGQHNIGVLAWGTLAHGFLVDAFDLTRLDKDDFRLRHPYAQEPFFGRLQGLRAVLQEIAHAHGKRLLDLALAWTLMRPWLSGAIVGIRNEKEASEMSGAVGWTLTREEITAIDDALVDLEQEDSV
jgi:aryl-alcohol dehydrogenase-like predicted oxidoreductase